MPFELPLTFLGNMQQQRLARSVLNILNGMKEWCRWLAAEHEFLAYKGKKRGGGVLLVSKCIGD